MIIGERATRIWPGPLLLITVLAFSSAALAEVLDAKPAGFTIRHSLDVVATRDVVYAAMVDDVGNWWNSDHSYSGDAGNLSIDASPMGCFCEATGAPSGPRAGVVHMTVTVVNPNQMLRLTGGLGPLGLMGLAGNMTWEFQDHADREEASTVVLTYAVGGYSPNGLDAIAPAVDGVLGEQLVRLKRFVETGKPE